MTRMDTTLEEGILTDIFVKEERRSSLKMVMMNRGWKVREGGGDKGELRLFPTQLIEGETEARIVLIR